MGEWVGVWVCGWWVGGCRRRIGSMGGRPGKGRARERTSAIHLMSGACMQACRCANVCMVYAVCCTMCSSACLTPTLASLPLCSALLLSAQAGSGGGACGGVQAGLALSGFHRHRRGRGGGGGAGVGTQAGRQEAAQAGSRGGAEGQVGAALCCAVLCCILPTGCASCS